MIKRMFGAKKGSTKSRTRKECDRDYADHAIQIGHQTRILTEMQKQIDAHLQDIELRTKEMIKINEECMKLPPEPPVPPSGPIAVQEQKEIA